MDEGAGIQEWPRELWGRPIGDVRRVSRVVLRYFLSELMASQPDRVWSPSALATELAALGFDTYGRASKEISDALRAEVNRGRVRRLGRGRYAAGTMPGSTRRRMRAVVRHRRALLERELVAEASRRFT